MSEERTRVLAPAQRVRSFKEVALGLNLRDAVENARIYLERERAIKGQPCPLGTDHLAIVRALARGTQASVAQARALLFAVNPLPEVTGRLCGEIFEETLCQNRRGDRISLRAIERFLAAAPVSGTDGVTPGIKRVAVIGSGPAGLSAAWVLRQAGYGVTVFDAASFLGGLLSYGQAEFELPRAALEAVFRRFRAAGIEFVTDTLFGRALMPEDLFDRGFAALLVATGTGIPDILGIPGENIGGVLSADDLLKAVNWRREDPRLWLGPRVVIVGDTDAAFACARLARRIKAEATVIIPGPESHIKANPVFVRHGIEEGVRLKAFTSPVEVIAGAGGCVAGLNCRYLDYRMDANGRMVLVQDETAGFTLAADTLITATGRTADTLFLRDVPGLEFNADGTLRTKPELAETGLTGVFAAGGVIEPGMSLTDAMLSGIRAAAEIDKHLAA